MLVDIARSVGGYLHDIFIGHLDLAGVWWLIRRKKRVPEILEG